MCPSIQDLSGMKQHTLLRTNIESCFPAFSLKQNFELDSGPEGVDKD